MSVRRHVSHSLHPGISGAIIRDRMTRDWLVVISPAITDVRHRMKIINDLLRQLEAWDEQETQEVREFLHRMVG